MDVSEALAQPLMLILVGMRSNTRLFRRFAG